jgi:DNA (cytosine-5)-methyltransferase 1
MNIFEMLHEEFKFDKNKTIRLFEAFSGYGSQQMALKRLGLKIEVVGYSEIDKYAIQVYEALHGKHKNYGGIGSFDRFPKDIDICTWSFPCQDISLAGRQRGMVDGSRSNYGYVFLDTIENTPYDERPKVLLMENVRALFSETFKDDWREIQIRLEKLGYTSYSDILNAKDYGIAQNRERVFIVSILGEYYYEFPKPYKLEKRLKDYLEDEVDEKYYLSDKQVKQIQSWKAQRDPLKDAKCEDDDILQTITAKSNTSMNSSMLLIKEEIYVGEYRRDEGIRTFKDGVIGTIRTIDAGGDKVVIIPEATKQGYALAEDGDGVYINRPHQKRGVVQKSMIQTIKTSCDDLGVVEESQKEVNVIDEEIVFQINEFTSVVKVKEKTYIKSGEHYFRIRKLTPREALRLMDVSENDIDIILSEVSNTQAYKLAGNSIVVNVLVEIFRKLF